jgi:DNA-binding response OmpR family regulator
MTALMLSATFKRLGYEVTVVHDGISAWNHIESQKPSLAIIDWMMPGLDGLELCRRVRALPEGEQIYLMLLTSRTNRGDIVAGFDAGADDYLVKPFDPDELHARIRAGARIVTLQHRLAEQVAELRDTMARMKQLSGLLPICSYCKRIRSDQNYWEQVDSYITEHTDARFSHGICPTCYDKAMAEIEASDVVG